MKAFTMDLERATKNYFIYANKESPIKRPIYVSKDVFAGSPAPVLFIELGGKEGDTFKCTKVTKRCHKFENPDSDIPFPVFVSKDVIPELAFDDTINIRVVL